MRSVHTIRVCTLLASLFAAAFCCAEEPSAAKKIVALSPHSVELLFALGAGDRIVATISFADFPEAAKTIPRVGGYNGLQLESILSLKPDLIVAWEGGNPSDDIDQLERLGLRVYRSETKRLSDIEKEVLELGRLTGLNARAEELAADFRVKWEQLQFKNKHKQAVSFFYQLWKEPLRTMAAGSWINEIMTSCGGVNVFNDKSLDYPQVGLEAILKAKPSAIIVPSHHGSDLGDAKQWSQWTEIPAIQNQHIFSINGDLLHRFSLRVIEGMREVCAALDKVRAFSSVQINSQDK